MEYIDRPIGPGYYLRVGANIFECRTILLDALEAAPSSSKKQLQPLMHYFQGILDSRQKILARGRITPPSDTDHLGQPLCFTLFGKMPLELRGMAWGLALSGERVLEMYTWPGSFTRTASVRQAHASVLNVLRVCRESQEVVMKRYKKALVQGMGWDPIHPYQDGVSTYLIDYTRDIAYFPKTSMGGLLDCQLLRTGLHQFGKFVRVALNITSLRYIESNGMREYNFISKHFGVLKNLEEMIFVADEERFMAGMEASSYNCLRVDFEDPDCQVEEGVKNLLPLQRMDLMKEKDHPYLGLNRRAIADLKTMLKSEVAMKQHKGITISLEMWRRPTYDMSRRKKDEARTNEGMRKT